MTRISGIEFPLKAYKIAFAVWCGAALSMTSAAPTMAAASSHPVFPAIALPRAVGGEQAIRALGEELSAVATFYGLTPERLTDILRNDHTVRLDRTGRLFYIDEFDTPLPAVDALTPQSIVAAAPPYNVAQTFLLHSKPGSRRVLYLDFNGHTATNTAWNSGTINAQPFDLDGIPASFSNAEKERIQYIWQRVAEDYAPFDLDVTTQAPAADALTRMNSADDTYGTRVVITKNTFYPCNCGGVAYVGVFDYYSNWNPSYYQPAWVFFDALGNGGEKYVAEAISHEAGHNLGLYHDGTSTTGYYAGHGSGVNGWAPIMGVGFSQPVVQWSKGEYPDANNPEDDIAVIQATGAPLRADDFGNTRATAALLKGVAGIATFAVNQIGVIERRTDLDFFKFTTGAGTIQLAVNPYPPRAPNLNLAAGLFDSAGVAVVAANPAGSLGASINRTLPAGTYYLRIDGAKNGDLTTGYSDYGSLGKYRITGAYPIP